MTRCFYHTDLVQNAVFEDKLHAFIEARVDF